MTDTDQKEQLINDAEVINTFLENESVRRVFSAYDGLLWRRWKAENDPAGRERIFAQARAFDEIATGLRAVVDSGKRETHEMEPANRTEALA